MSETKQSNTARIIGLGVDEMFEDLTYSVAYNEVLTRLKNSGMPDGILNDAINSGISIMFSAALMTYIQKQEAIIHKIVGIAGSLLIATLTPVRAGAKNLFKKFSKGRKLGMFSKIFGDSDANNISYGQVIATSANSAFNATQSMNSAYSRSNVAMQQREHILNTKNHQMNYAKAKVDSINQTLLFKLFTSKFTSQDKEILRKITGSSEINIENINKVASFMFVTDSNGDITGLAEQFTTMLNGLGYFHNKGKK
ncbi:hypothetical protein CPIN18020_0284 [Campylobacter pinnipediorum subsp. caledonicus]|uniref:hypothetical protein n=1 Tax=Campylobacter pinnipediorum TaxID=1965231 RepID=UPI0009949A43|nr:hypothetical protein [Campylobacter pinnipediorum]AQW85528.1 hypothetical protein CPIN18020_0284 [Campylobacter pinnipediorum subsp. caledonicus]